MSSAWRVLVAFLLAGGASAAVADSGREILAKQCVQPPPPSLPDGRTATAQQMREAQKAVKAFIAGAEDYGACLNEWERPAKDAEVREKRAIEAKREAAIRSIRNLAERFNAEVRTYKQRQEDLEESPN